MADIHSPATRSYNMSKIKSKNTKPELVVRKFLFANGFRYRLYVKYLAGKPDIVLKKYKTVIFINGCFWHGHKNCPYFIIPKTRTTWWTDKIITNIKRDKQHYEILNKEGWNIITIWECQLKKKVINKTLNDLLVKLNSI